MGTGILTPTQNRILDAALDILCTTGPRTATVSAVANAADVSRMTVYRNYPDRAAILSAVLNRELGQIAAGEVSAMGAGQPSLEDIVVAVVSVTDQIRAHAAVRSVLESEPSALTPWMTQRFGSTQRLAIELITEWLRDADASVRRGDPETMAQTIVLAAQSFVFADRFAPATGELAHLIRGYLESD